MASVNRLFYRLKFLPSTGIFDQYCITVARPGAVSTGQIIFKGKHEENTEQYVLRYLPESKD
jgi:hypothetical protein